MGKEEMREYFRKMEGLSQSSEVQVEKCYSFLMEGVESSEHSSDNCDVDSDELADKAGRKDTNQSVKPARNKMLDTHRCIGHKSLSAEKDSSLKQAMLASQQIDSKIKSSKFSRTNVFDYS